MSSQATLPLEPVRRPVARRDNPETSWQAARSISREAMSYSQMIVQYHLAAYGPMTDEQIKASIPPRVSPSRARTARHELVGLGLVTDGVTDPECKHYIPRMKKYHPRIDLWVVLEDNRRCGLCQAHQRLTRSGRWATVWRIRD